MDNIGEVIHVQVVEGSASSVCDAEQVESIELGSVSSVDMVVDSIEQNQNVEGGSEVMSVDDVERVRIVEEGILAMNEVGDAERVRFIVEGDLGSGETDDENETHVNGDLR
ncbi:hypothetical protein CTI12_AA462810 [Artemisia annua]|uniref:Uncharacterized protein n=1 Tax=Artemisia annua TaxID=35608 RepID=A0A2U1L8C1_ARTAN|nr:hypothetical protein CTI12_AA462810 [Artemisia annua]